MKSLQLIVSVVAMVLLAACAGTDQAQVDSTEPGTTGYQTAQEKPQVHMVGVQEIGRAHV